MKSKPGNKKLTRQLGLLGLAATGICSMLGASVYVVPFMIQRNVPGIGPYVLPAFLFAAIPALLAALAYAILASAMPRAGGSYIYVSRGLNPYLGFVASFSQWFGLSIAIGVISYLIIPFLRDIASALSWPEMADFLDAGWVRVVLALVLLWLFVWVNIRGLRFYEKVLVPMMVLMFALGAVVIVVGLFYNHQDFASALLAKEGIVIAFETTSKFSLNKFLAAAALLFASFIGFDSIAQAGGEARNPARSLPLAIGIAILTVSTYYFLFTASVYHAVPWQFVAGEAMNKDITAPGLLSYLLPGIGAVIIISGAAVALINDLPAMLLSVSRLMFAWAEDGIFAKKVATIHPEFGTPNIAIFGSGLMATIGVLGSHFAGDFFLGIDIMVTSMLVNFLLMCLTVITLPGRNPVLFKQIKVMRSRTLQLLFACLGVLMLTGFLIIHIWKDFQAEVSAWYFHSTLVWIMVLAVASLVFVWKWFELKQSGVDIEKTFAELPPET